MEYMVYHRVFPLKLPFSPAELVSEIWTSMLIPGELPMRRLALCMHTSHLGTIIWNIANNTYRAVGRIIGRTTSCFAEHPDSQKESI